MQQQSDLWSHFLSEQSKEKNICAQKEDVVSSYFILCGISRTKITRYISQISVHVAQLIHTIVAIQTNWFNFVSNGRQSIDVDGPLVKSKLKVWRFPMFKHDITVICYNQPVLILCYSWRKQIIFGHKKHQASCSINPAWLHYPIQSSWIHYSFIQKISRQLVQCKSKLYPRLPSDCTLGFPPDQVCRYVQ